MTCYYTICQINVNTRLQNRNMINSNILHIIFNSVSLYQEQLNNYFHHFTLCIHLSQKIAEKLKFFGCSKLYIPKNLKCSNK